MPPEVRSRCHTPTDAGLMDTAVTTGFFGVLTTASTKDEAATTSEKTINKHDMVLKKIPNCIAETVAQKDWGYPGFLTEEEYKTFEAFRQEVYTRSDDFRSTVFSFSAAHEEEAYALCRWLRARKYKLVDTIKMVEEATQCTAKHREKSFYPSPYKALGVESSIYISQYPQIYYGYAKNGCPVFISKPGILNVPGLECITSLEGILNYHWYAMMHDFVKNLQKQYKSSSGQFKRYECICILDLAHLTSSQLSKRALNIIKTQSQIDSLCFPETLNRMVVVNAPSFFTMSWKIMKNWVDSRTSNKVDILGTNRAKWELKLREYIETENLPEDYGGTGESTVGRIEKDTIRQCEEMRRSRSSCSDETEESAIIKEKKNILGKVKRQETFLMNVRSVSSRSIALEAGEIMTCSVFTRSCSGGYLSIMNPAGNRILCVPGHGILIRHKGNGGDDEIESPTRINLDDAGVFVEGMGTHKIKIESNGKRFSTETFLLVVTVFSRTQHESSSISVDTEVFSSKQKVKKSSPLRNPTKNLSADTVTYDNARVLDFNPSVGRKPKALRRQASNEGDDGVSEDDRLVDVPLAPPSSVMKIPLKSFEKGIGLNDVPGALGSGFGPPILTQARETINEKNLNDSQGAYKSNKKTMSLNDSETLPQTGMMCGMLSNLCGI